MLNRRRWLGSVMALGAVGTVMLSPLRALAAPRAGFEAESVDSALQALLAGRPVEESDQITLKIPDIAENGAVVPVTVSTDQADVSAISIVIDNNPNPLTGRFEISPDAVAEISTRVKMGESSRVRAFVETPGKVLTTSKDVKVTIGGCGG